MGAKQSQQAGRGDGEGDGAGGAAGLGSSLLSFAQSIGKSEVSELDELAAAVCAFYVKRMMDLSYHRQIWKCVVPEILSGRRSRDCLDFALPIWKA